MTEYELDIARRAFVHVLNMGAPGLSTDMKEALVGASMRRIRHQLDMPVPTLTSAYQDIEK